MTPLSRRGFLASAAAGMAAAPLGSAAASGSDWDQAAAILKRIRAPEFPDRTFGIERFGAKSGGDSSEAIRKAIAACAAAGGGRVVVPAGEFLTGPIHFENGVDLHLAEGSILKFSRDPKQYLPVVLSRFEGIECMNYSPLLYALGKENIAISGSGTLDGNASEEFWWPWKGTRNRAGAGAPNQNKARAALVEMGEKDVPVAERVFGEGGCLRPAFVQFYRCRNVLIEGVRIRNSPMWELNPVLCRNVTVRGVAISSHGPNNDGCDPECSKDVLIENCDFDTGDDCIAIKSGRNRDGRRVGVACENLVIRGCRMKDGHGGVTIGSEVSGDVRNVFVEDCKMDSPHLDRVLRLKSNAVRGGVIEHVRMRNVEAGQVAAAAIDIDFHYEEGEKGAFPPVVRDVLVENVTCRKSKHALYLRGFAGAPIRDVRLRHCRFENAAEPNLIEHVEGLSLEDVTINGQAAPKG